MQDAQVKKLLILSKLIVIGPETNYKIDPKRHYPHNTNSHLIILNCVQITLHYFQCQISAMPLVRATLFWRN